ncbi:PREDICTED: formin-like protein 18 [Colobus angolensis palliatus]|uniref:formin-like protein 18 n=1 Tax=Colobus angolensis palliatus TaxID=336983 RepID=UPI0005F43CAF|nr:PREDICTED: formin-like protein 18 [Colobus angolensis palliatus]
MALKMRRGAGWAVCVYFPPPHLYPPARSLPKATTCTAPLTICPAGRAPPRASGALPAPGRLWRSSVFASSPSLPEDQVPPLLPLQLRPPPPPPSCMTQQNRSCCSNSKPSAQEAPQPGLGRGGGGEAGATAPGDPRPHCAPHTPFPAQGHANKMRLKLTRPSWRNAGAWQQKGWDQREGCGGDPSEGQDISGKERSYLRTSLPDTNKFSLLSATKP